MTPLNLKCLGQRYLTLKWKSKVHGFIWKKSSENTIALSSWAAMTKKTMKLFLGTAYSSSGIISEYETNYTRTIPSSLD